ncbi:MAG: F0F1 ATP synthase subunit B [Prevotellaceae bacterium]|nr:F0F1 ATP synthase subunit B [Candidatus Minthosoma caballi]
MNLLTPDPGLLFWMVLSFAVVFLLLAKFGFPVIVGAINKRKEFIEMSLLSAKQANEKLAKIQEESEQLLADAKAKQKDIIASAMQEKQKILEAAQEEARSSAKQIVDEATAHIAAEKDKALREVRSEVAALAIDIAEKIVGEKMSNTAEQQRTIEKLIDEL